MDANLFRVRWHFLLAILSQCARQPLVLRYHIHRACENDAPSVRSQPWHSETRRFDTRYVAVKDHSEGPRNCNHNRSIESVGGRYQFSSYLCAFIINLIIIIIILTIVMLSILLVTVLLGLLATTSLFSEISHCNCLTEASTS